VLLDPFSSDPEKEASIREWLKDHHSQPCVSERLQETRRIDFCFITAKDITTSDDHVAAKIADAVVSEAASIHRMPSTASC